MSNNLLTQYSNSKHKIVIGNDSRVMVGNEPIYNYYFADKVNFSCLNLSWYEKIRTISTLVKFKSYGETPTSSDLYIIGNTTVSGGTYTTIDILYYNGRCDV